MNEQERADKLDKALEQIIRGESSSMDDPLLGEAQKLLALPVNPSQQAVKRFNSRVDQWFKPAPPIRVLRFPKLWGGLLVVGFAALILYGFVYIQRQFAVASPVPTLFVFTQTATLTSTASATPSFALTETESLVSTITPVTSTPTPGSIMILGQIEAVATNSIVLQSELVTVSGGTNGLCVGDRVRFFATVRTNDTLFVNRSAITLLASACPTAIQTTPILTPTTGSGGGSTSVPPTIGPSPVVETPESHPTPEATQKPAGTEKPDNKAH